MSKSLEALENVKTAPSFMGGNPRYWTCLQSSIPFLEDINTIKQDLERKEELEKEYDNLKKDYDNKDLECIDLYKENQELKDLLKLIVNRGSVVLGNKLYGREVCFLGINERYIISKEQYEILDELRTDVIIKAKE